MKLSEHFDSKEFACKCGCGFDTINKELISVLEELRLHFDKPIHINSGCRCEEYNKVVGGETYSKHMLGIAADIVIPGVSAGEVTDYLLEKYPKKYGIGRYKTWTHIDVRLGKARWDKT